MFVADHDRLKDLSGRGAARAEDVQGTPTQSHISPSILVYEANQHGTRPRGRPHGWSLGFRVQGLGFMVQDSRGGGKINTSVPTMYLGVKVSISQGMRGRGWGSGFDANVGV